MGRQDVGGAVGQPEVLRHLAGQYGDVADVCAVFGIKCALCGLCGGQRALRLFDSMGINVSGAEASLGILQHFLQDGDVGGGSLLPRLHGTGVQVIGGNFAAQQELRAVQGFLLPQCGIACGIGVAAFTPENIGFPGCLYACGQQVLAAA